MTRAVSVLEVADEAVWKELEAMVPLAVHVREVLDEVRRVVAPSFERQALPELRKRGAVVLLRHARRPVGAARASTGALAERISALSHDARTLLFAAQRHALDDIVLGAQVWDPEHDGPVVRELMGAEMVAPLADADGPAWAGRFHLNPDLPPPPPLSWSFDEAVMELPDDLDEGGGSSPVQLLHDLASLAAALHHVQPRRTHAGTVAKVDARTLGRRLGSAELGKSGQLEADLRWGRALHALELLGAVSMDPVSRQLQLDLGLQDVLAGSTAEAVDRLVRKLVDRDLQSVLPAVRAALAAAGPGAVDDVVFLELICEQHRDLLFRPWSRRGVALYPSLGDATLRRFDDAGFEEVERPMVRALLSRLHRLGLLRRAPGVFAATPSGRIWAGADDGPMPPVWVSSDLEVVVPPDALTPWERLAVERLGRCVSRDVVDRYRLDRDGLMSWLATQELQEALELLGRRCHALPSTVVDTLTSWAASARRVVLTRGVLLDDVDAREAPATVL
ncbi:MAG: hypothetical protein KTR31_17360 [Myxococcales bacterium]|nr:hypothetical protein [Myxococcales bacterium]